MFRKLMSLALAGLCLAAIVSTISCEPDPGVPVRKVSSSSDVKVHKSTIDRNALEIAEGNWKPVKNWEIQMMGRNPFRGFTDTMLAELVQQQQMAAQGLAPEEQLPEQLYNVKDYTLVGVITGTAEPKAYVIDPAGNRFILRRGSLVGNNNGSVSSIRRDGIEVFEMISGEGVFIDVPLYDTKKDSGIQMTLQ